MFGITVMEIIMVYTAIRTALCVWYSTLPVCHRAAIPVRDMYQIMNFTLQQLTACIYNVEFIVGSYSKSCMPHHMAYITP